MERWVSFFADYNFNVEYKPGRLNVVADALLRRPDFKLVAFSNSEDTPAVSALVESGSSSTLLEDVRKD